VNSNKRLPIFCTFFNLPYTTLSSYSTSFPTPEDYPSRASGYSLILPLHPPQRLSLCSSFPHLPFIPTCILTYSFRLIRRSARDVHRACPLLYRSRHSYMLCIRLIDRAYLPVLNDEYWHTILPHMDVFSVSFRLTSPPCRRKSLFSLNSSPVYGMSIFSFLR